MSHLRAAFVVFCCVFASSQSLLASAAAKPVVLLKYDTIQVDHDAGLIIVRGNVEVAYDKRQLFADVMSYHSKEDIIIASGNVRLHENSGEVLFTSYIELSDKMSKGFCQNLKILLQDNARMAGQRGYRLNEKQFVVERGVYSPCQLCPSRPPFWQLKAKRIVDDKNVQDVFYRDFWMEVQGIPVFYSPYLRHAGPGVKRRSGFLVPVFSQSSLNGFGLAVPYYYTRSPQEDITLTPVGTTKGGHLLGVEYRKRFPQGYGEFTGSMALISHQQQRTLNQEELKTGRMRGHLFGTVRYELNDYWSLNVDAKMVTDQTYLKRYPFLGPPLETILSSKAEAEGFYGQNYAALKSYVFYALSQDANFSQTPMVVPLSEYSQQCSTPFNGTWRMGVNLINLHRPYGNQLRRLSFHNEWIKRHITAGGHTWTVTGSVKMDGYYTSFIPKGSRVMNPGEQYPSYGSKVLCSPQAAIEYRWPLIATSQDTLIEPYAALMASPGLRPDIPNEDSKYFEFNEINFYQVDRFPGFDRIDEGHRAQYGLTLSHHFPATEAKITAQGGQSIYLISKKFDPLKDDIQHRQSDWVGSLKYTWGKNLEIYNRFRLDHKSLYPLKSEIGFLLQYQGYRWESDYLILSKKITPIRASDRRYCNFLNKISFPLDTGWRVNLQSVVDTDRRWQVLAHGLGVTYQNDCFTFTSNLSKTFYYDRDIRPNLSLIFTFVFKNLGSYTTGDYLSDFTSPNTSPSL